jgi:hypothetical protein
VDVDQKGIAVRYAQAALHQGCYALLALTKPDGFPHQSGEENTL